MSQLLKKKKKSPFYNPVVQKPVFTASVVTVIRPYYVMLHMYWSNGHFHELTFYFLQRLMKQSLHSHIHLLNTVYIFFLSHLFVFKSQNVQDDYML